MGEQHKHAELIKAWADGTTIESKRKDSDDTMWMIDPNPSWGYDWLEFRIKPKEKQKVKMWQWVFKNTWGNKTIVGITESFFANEQSVEEVVGDDKHVSIIQRADWTEIEVEVGDE